MGHHYHRHRITPDLMHVPGVLRSSHVSKTVEKEGCQRRQRHRFAIGEIVRAT